VPSHTLDDADEALHTALRFLARRARSEAEISEHLTRKGFSRPVADQSLEKLRRMRYAGDERFAADWARSRAHGRGYGPHRIRQELRTKGIDEPLISAVLREAFAGNAEARQARSILEKRFGREKPKDPKSLRRAAAFLKRRGYSETVIMNLLRETED
jgi:regulatory protein